jgi:hypothetical protein
MIHEAAVNLNRAAWTHFILRVRDLHRHAAGFRADLPGI